MLTTMRWTLAARWSGVTAMSAMMVEQLGLAMMPPLPYLQLNEAPLHWDE